MDAPFLEAGFYWPHEAPQVSLRRVCQILIHYGMSTGNFGAFADPDAALLSHLEHLEQPDPDIRAVSFVTSSKRQPRKRPTHRPPGKILVSYGLLSDAAKAHGDHPTIQVDWDGSSFSGPVGYISKDTPSKGLQAYHFFTQLCTDLDPLYAAMEVEMEVPCLYDFLHSQVSKSYAHLPLSEFYCRQGVLGDAEEAFWRSYAYSECLPRGTYGSDDRFFNPRRRGLSDDAKYRRHVYAERQTILTAYLSPLAKSRLLYD